MEHDIFAAITANDKERVAQLIAADAGVAHARNANGISALMQARYENRLEIVDLLRPAGGELDVFESAALGDVAHLSKLLVNDGQLVKARSSRWLHAVASGMLLRAAPSGGSPGPTRSRCQCRFTQPDRGDPQCGSFAQCRATEACFRRWRRSQYPTTSWLHRIA